MMVAVNECTPQGCGTGLQYLLTDHLGSTVAVTNASGTLTSQQRYLPFGGARSIPNSPIAGTDFTYTGQRMLDSGMGGIMDYTARFYSPYINRFLQPDTVIPDQTNPQSWNRFSYVRNNPIRFNDPTGHLQCDPEDARCQSKKLSKAETIKYRLEYYYDIDITGGWDETELLHLEESLNKTAKYLGSKDNLNKAIQASLAGCKKCAGKDFLTIYNSPGKTICYGTSYNCYDPNTATITIADYTFSPTYQKGKNRPRELGLDNTGMGSQVSIVHEISHMLGEANPAALSVYKGYVADPKALSPNNGPEESRANAMAYYIVSGGNTIAPYKYQEHLDYARDTAFLWNSSP